MKVSYNWLQSYFDEKLPEPEKLGELITFSFAELDGMEKGDTDTVLDLKILPDRACYALSHRGVAQEVSAILNIPLKKKELPAIAEGETRSFSFAIENEALCRRHIGRVIEGISVQKSPPWLVARLGAIGQRSINTIVDATNFVTLDMGQPLHAFDADKVKGTVTIRPGKEGESVTTLDGKIIPVDPSILVIADEEGPLDIAGIKGGKKAELDARTKTILLSSANFDPVSIRKASAKIGIKTDASKRFENGITPERAEKGIDEVTALILELSARAVAGAKTDLYPKKAAARFVRFTIPAIRNMIGLAVSENEGVSLLKRLGIEIKKEDEDLVASVPFERLDLTIPQDIAEEIGRLIGYDKIPAELPPRSAEPLEIPPLFYTEWKVREVLTKAGFSEIMTSSFFSTGDVAILKPLAEDKKFARHSLRPNFEKALALNKTNAPLFSTDDIKIFEIGKVFSKAGEHAALAVGYAGPKKKTAAVMGEIMEILSREFGASVTGEMKDGIVEINLDAAFPSASPANWNISIPVVQNQKFAPFSVHPFIVRDIALFVSEATSSEEIAAVIKKEGTDLLLIGPMLFDDFVKEGRRSLAFRMVFQAPDRTLTDEEVNVIMEKIYAAAKKRGFEVR